MTQFIVFRDSMGSVEYCITLAHNEKEAMEKVAKKYGLQLGPWLKAHEVELDRNNTSDMYEITIHIRQLDYKKIQNKIKLRKPDETPRSESKRYGGIPHCDMFASQSKTKTHKPKFKKDEEGRVTQ